MRLLLAAIACALALLVSLAGPLGSAPALAQPFPAAPLASPDPTPAKTAATATPSPSGTPRGQADPEGDRLVQLALVVGIGLIGTVLLLFVVGAVVRRRYRVS
ncbi:MAG: hypothetical protein WCF12_02930 [Propionicimonas sp.]